MSFDLSTTNILLAGAVAALFIAFVLVLMKLKPTSENKPSQEPIRNMEKEKSQLQQAPQPPKALPLPIKPLENSISSKPPAPVVQAPKPLSAEIQAKPTVLVPPHIENREPPKQNKTSPSSARPELTPTRKDCIHFYGYLRSLPKNTPIPDECFGCVKIVDCLVSPNSPSSSANSNHKSGHNSNHNSKKRGWL